MPSLIRGVEYAPFETYRNRGGKMEEPDFARTIKAGSQEAITLLRAIYSASSTFRKNGSNLLSIRRFQMRILAKTFRGKWKRCSEFWLKEARAVLSSEDH